MKCAWGYRCGAKNESDREISMFDGGLLRLPICDQCYEAHLIVLSLYDGKDIEPVLMMEDDERYELACQKHDNLWEELNSIHKKDGNEDDIPEWFGKKE